MIQLVIMTTRNATKGIEIDAGQDRDHVTAIEAVDIIDMITVETGTEIETEEMYVYIFYI